MQLNQLKLLRLIKNYQISFDLLDKYLNSQKNSYLALSNLIFDSNIPVTNYFQISAFLSQISEHYFNTHQYNNSEKVWLSFFLLLRAYKDNLNDAETLYTQYENLPVLQTNADFIKWIQLQIRMSIIYQCKYLDVEIDQLRNDILSTPEEIQIYSP